MQINEKNGKDDLNDPSDEPGNHYESLGKVIPVIPVVSILIKEIQAKEPDARTRAERMMIFIADLLEKKCIEKSMLLKKEALKGIFNEDLDSKNTQFDFDNALLTHGDALADTVAKLNALSSKFEPSAWLSGAVLRAGDISLVTHTAKGIHPSDRATRGIFAMRSIPDSLGIIGTHSLEGEEGSGSLENFESDVASSNASSLDVYGFASQAFEGASLIQLGAQADSDLVDALAAFQADGAGFCSAMKAMSHCPESIELTYLGKQVYEFVGENVLAPEDFDLLSIYFQSSLVHAVHGKINEIRFSEDTKSAREAKRAGLASPHVLHDYSHLAQTQIAGGNPQNAGQLNLERRGAVLMLGCIAPKWTAAEVRPAFGVESLFDIIGRRRVVRSEIREFADFLLSGPTANARTRNRRDAFTNELIDLVIAFAAEQRAQKSGWSSDTRCRLLSNHKALVDIGAIGANNAFDAESFSLDFANWLSDCLGDSLPLVAASTRQFKQVALDAFEIFADEKISPTTKTTSGARHA